MATYIQEKEKTSRHQTMINKKVIGAKTEVYNGIKFRSQLEVYCYKYLESVRLPFAYETKTFTLLKEFVDPNPIWVSRKKRGKNTKEFVCKEQEKVQSITYTPDFVLKFGDTWHIIDTKGFATDVFKIKAKLFRDVAKGKSVVFYLPSTKKEVRTVVGLLVEIHQKEG